MFKKHKAAKAQKKNADVVGLITSTEEYFEQIDEKISAAEDTADAAEKILTLNGLKDEIQKAGRQANDKQDDIVGNRAFKKSGVTGGTGAAIGAAAVVVPATVLAAPVVVPLVVIFGVVGAMGGFVIPLAATENLYLKTTRKKLVEQNPIITYFGNILAAQKTRVQEVLDDTIKNCDLEEISLSPRFKEAFDSSAPLRDRFALAATDTATQALEAKAEAQQEAAETAKTQREPGTPNRLKLTIKETHHV